jgi:hypothetical protein
MSDAPDFQPDRRSTVVTEESVSRFQFQSPLVVGIADGDSVIEQVAPAPGKILNITGLYLDVLPNGGSGDHELEVRPNSDSILTGINVVQPGTEPVRFEGVDVPNPSTASTVFPTSAGARAQAVRVLRATDSDPVELRYVNNTGQNQGNAVVFKAGGVTRDIA